jgi:hypothetical protein
MSSQASSDPHRGTFAQFFSNAHVGDLLVDLIGTAVAGHQAAPAQHSRRPVDFVQAMMQLSAHQNQGLADCQVIADFITCVFR